MNFRLWLENNNYPSIKWIKSTLRMSVYAPMRLEILAAYVIGSEAKGIANPDSDLDIAVIIPPIKGKTSIKKTQEYHNKFSSDNLKPVWNERRVDFQFFYPNDPELNSYSKIQLF